MVQKGLNTAGGALAAVALTAAALAGCEQRPAPPPAYEASGADSRATELAGGVPGEPAPPPGAAIEAPPPEAEPPPPSGRGDEVVYDLGPVVPAPAPVTMAPIPNPPQPVRAERRVAAATPHARPRASHRVHRAARPAPVARQAAPAPRPAPQHATASPRPVTLARPVAQPSPASKPAVTAHAVPDRAARPLPPAAPLRPAAPVSAAPARAERAKHAKSAEHSPGAASKGRKAKVAADQGVKLQALQTALRDAVSAKAQLIVPRLAANTPADVVLTLPADFAQSVRSEAEKAGLSDAAASVNLTAALSGDGYAVTPDEVQAQPLTVGQPTEFHWTVTAQPGARGPLRADVGADLLGGGRETLALGAVVKSAPGAGVSPRALGAGLLALIVVAVLAWLARGGRGRRDRETTVRRSSLSGGHDRPVTLDPQPPRPGTNGQP